MRNAIRWTLINAFVNLTLFLSVAGIYLSLAKSASDSGGSTLSGLAVAGFLLQAHETIEGFLRFVFIYALLLFGAALLLRFRVRGSKIVAGVVAIPAIFLPWGTFGAYATIVSLFDKERSFTSGSSSFPPYIRRYVPAAAIALLLLVLGVFFAIPGRRNAQTSSQSATILPTEQFSSDAASTLSQPTTGQFIAAQPTDVLPTFVPQPTYTPQPTLTPEPAIAPAATVQPAPTSAIEQPPALIPADRFQVSTSNVGPSGQDACGQSVTYNSENVKDGKNETAWRVSGNGRGEWLQLDFAAPLKISQIAILPGYSKTDPCGTHTHRWPQGFRPSLVELIFSDGTNFTRDLADEETLQHLDFPPVVAQTVRIVVIDSRSPLASGVPPYMAISEITVTGTTP